MKISPLALRALPLFVLPIFAQAVPITYTATLSGLNESTPVVTPATGSVMVSYDPAAHILDVDVNFTGLIGGDATAAHIHAPAPPGTSAGVAIGFPGFPAATGGIYQHQFDLTSASVFSAAYLAANGGTAAGAESALASALASGNAYFNIHNRTYPPGEVRGDLRVPDEISPAAMLGVVGLLALACRRFRRPLAA